MAGSLSVTTNTSSQIVIDSNYGSGTGNRYSFYSASSTVKGSNTLGEGGLAEWYHGAAGYRATTTTTATSTQASCGWDASNGDGGLFLFDVEQGVACTGSGSAFGVANASNGAMQTVHLKGATGASVIEKQWTIWANGVHAIAVRFTVAQGANSVFPESNFRAAYGSLVMPSTTQGKWGFAGTNSGVMVSLTGSGSGYGGGGGTSSINDNSAGSDVFVTKGASAAAGSTTAALLAVDGYEGSSVVSTALVDAFDADYNTHAASGANSLSVSTGSKTTSGTDEFGNTGTTWTDGFDPQRGAYIIAASSNHVNLGGTTAAAWGIDGTTVTARFSPRYVMTGWTDSAATPTVKYGATTLVSGTDFIAYNDTTNNVLYLCLLADIGSGGTRTSSNISGLAALDVSAGGGGPSDPFPLVYAVTGQQGANAVYRM